jgi:hypothetical protein
VEGWRHLGLDIQSEEVLTIEDALNELSRPETVQVSSSSGTLIDGSKQYLIDDLPLILILHLKRFQYDPTLKDVIKQRKVIRFDSDLVIPKSRSSLYFQSSVLTVTRRHLFYCTQKSENTQLQIICWYVTIVTNPSNIKFVSSALSPWHLCYWWALYPGCSSSEPKTRGVGERFAGRMDSY